MMQMTYDLSRYGISDGQIVVGGIYNFDTWEPAERDGVLVREARNDLDNRIAYLMPEAAGQNVGYRLRRSCRFNGRGCRSVQV